MKETILKFLRDEEGATAVEYGLIAALIAVAIIFSVTELGTALEGVFNNIAGAITGAGAGTGG
ncbi:MAG: Flp family type IVb pilin [Thiobacillus sp.]|nr:Flp family type IVb pilin [Thiobacillus sp.]